MEEGGKRVGRGFRDMMRALGDVDREGRSDPTFHAALLDVQVPSFSRADAVPFAFGLRVGVNIRSFTADSQFTGIICHV